MNLMTRFELASLTEQDLYALHDKAYRLLACALADEPAMRDLIATLENIRSELANRC